MRAVAERARKTFRKCGSDERGEIGSRHQKKHSIRVKTLRSPACACPMFSHACRAVDIEVFGVTRSCIVGLHDAILQPRAREARGPRADHADDVVFSAGLISHVNQVRATAGTTGLCQGGSVPLEKSEAMSWLQSVSAGVQLAELQVEVRCALRQAGRGGPVPPSPRAGASTLITTALVADPISVR